MKIKRSTSRKDKLDVLLNAMTSLLMKIHLKSKGVVYLLQEHWTPDTFFPFLIYPSDHSSSILPNYFCFPTLHRFPDPEDRTNYCRCGDKQRTISCILRECRIENVCIKSSYKKFVYDLSFFWDASNSSSMNRILLICSATNKSFQGIPKDELEMLAASILALAQTWNDSHLRGLSLKSDNAENTIDNLLNCLSDINSSPPYLPVLFAEVSRPGHIDKSHRTMNLLAWNCRLLSLIENEKNFPWILAMPEKISEIKQGNYLESLEKYDEGVGEIERNYIKATQDYVRVLQYPSNDMDERWWLFARHNQFKDSKPNEELVGKSLECISLSNLMESVIQYKATKNDILVTLWAVREKRSNRNDTTMWEPYFILTKQGSHSKIERISGEMLSSDSHVNTFEKENLKCKITFIAKKDNNKDDSEELVTELYSSIDRVLSVCNNHLTDIDPSDPAKAFLEHLRKRTKGWFEDGHSVIKHNYGEVRHSMAYRKQISELFEFLKVRPEWFITHGNWLHESLKDLCGDCTRWMGDTVKADRNITVGAAYLLFLAVMWRKKVDTREWLQKNPECWELHESSKRLEGKARIFPEKQNSENAERTLECLFNVYHKVCTDALSGKVSISKIVYEESSFFKINLNWHAASDQNNKKSLANRLGRMIEDNKGEQLTTKCGKTLDSLISFEIANLRNTDGYGAFGGIVIQGKDMTVYGNEI